MTAASTQCPKCNTTFRVSDAQLQVAKGKVRCGSCLHVFKAADYWVGAPAGAKAAPAAATKPAAGATDKKPGKFQFDQSAIDSASAEKLLTRPSMPAVNTLGEMRAVAAQPPKKDEEEFLISDEDEGLISDGQDTQAQKATPAVESGEDYSDLFLNLDDLQDDGYEATRDESLGGKESEAADESWAKEMLNEITDTKAQKEAQMKAILSAGAKDKIFVDDGHVKKREGARDGFVSGNREEPDQALKDLGMDKPPSKKPMTRREMVSRIEPAPVDILGGASGPTQWLGPVLWSGLTVLALLALLVQYAWINFESLARENALRPLYATACGVVGCKLPDQFNPDAIRTSNLTVRSSPQLSYALMVDFMMLNTADYAQPFPELELSFTDINNFPVASRRFKPEEYLAGELAGKKEMPPAKSVQVSMQILDPGARAVSYDLHIVERAPATH